VKSRAICHLPIDPENAPTVDDAAPTPHSDAETAATDTGGRASLFAALINVLRPRDPHPPPPGWAKFTTVFVAVTIIVCALLVLAGWYLRDKPNRHFGEWRIGTFMSVGFLWGSAFLCHRNHRRTRGESVSRFWFWMAVLLAFLGLDDLLKIHETLDHLINRMMGWNKRWVWADRMDDAIVVIYSLPAIALAWVNRFALLRLRWTVLTLGAAFMLFVAMVLIDVSRKADTLEDVLKVVAGALIFCAFGAADPPHGRDEALT
jgi:hypothetical protein